MQTYRETLGQPAVLCSAYLRVANATTRCSMRYPSPLLRMQHLDLKRYRMLPTSNSQQHYVTTNPFANIYFNQTPV
eukprot:16436132-Heterocapsa_arctica.AAC.1